MGGRGAVVPWASRAHVGAGPGAGAGPCAAGVAQRAQRADVGHVSQDAWPVDVAAGARHRPGDRGGGRGAGRARRGAPRGGGRGCGAGCGCRPGGGGNAGGGGGGAIADGRAGLAGGLATAGQVVRALPTAPEDLPSGAGDLAGGVRARAGGQVGGGQPAELALAEPAGGRGAGGGRAAGGGAAAGFAAAISGCRPFSLMAITWGFPVFPISRHTTTLSRHSPPSTVFRLEFIKVHGFFRGDIRT